MNKITEVGKKEDMLDFQKPYPHGLYGSSCHRRESTYRRGLG
jgi:hypothetical protein